MVAQEQIILLQEKIDSLDQPLAHWLHGQYDFFFACTWSGLFPLAMLLVASTFTYRSMKKARSFTPDTEHLTIIYSMALTIAAISNNQRSLLGTLWIALLTLLSMLSYNKLLLKIIWKNLLPIFLQKRLQKIFWFNDPLIGAIDDLTQATAKKEDPETNRLLPA